MALSCFFGEFFYLCFFIFFFFKQKTAYEMRISDWSSDVCSSDLGNQSRLAAEQMRSTGNVEDQPVGGVERDERRVARAALRDPVEPCGVGGGVEIGRASWRERVCQYV